MNSKIHPVYQLIRDARQAWDDKLDRQSRSLLEAVKEYRRRYGRAPPKGFDRWWKYVVENNVTLPDEYDQIDRDLLPFRSLSWRDLNRRVDRASRLPDTYTLQVENGSLSASVSFEEHEIYGSKERVEGQTALIGPISHELEDFRAVYWVHDTPSVLISHGHRSELRQYLDEEEYFDDNEEIDLSLRGWPAMCPADSPMGIKRGRTPDAFELSKGTRGSYAFIADHYQSMDLCEHPELVSLHGLLLGKDPQVAPLTPLFVLSKTTLHADILGVPVEQIVRNIQDVPWEEKFEERLLWRGSNTGTHFSRETTWRDTHRTRLIKLVNEHRGKVDMLGPPREMDGKVLGKGRRQVPIEVANGYYHDMAFTGEPIQCIVSDGTCEELADEYRFAGLMTHEAALYYKYVIDVDGNAWSARFQRLLAAGSLIFKTTIFPEWWTDRIQPWVHYVPIQVDYSDLYDVIAFFRGDTSGRGGEPSLAKEIAGAGKEWADTNWRPAEMITYVFRLYLEWARLLAPNRGGMDFVYDERMEQKIIQ
ncbi:hypothetical protein JCM24511_10202 [Saitozyma sp. JCM 24511]|nr:hypothetical protein JCM24511_10202 [Saitozyma sp. JCM 24511]